MLDRINLLNLKFLMRLYIHQHTINFCSLMLLFFFLLHFLLRYLSHKHALTNHEHVFKQPTLKKNETLSLIFP